MSDNWYDQNVDSDVADAVIRLNIKLSNRAEINRDFRPDIHIDYDQLEKQLEEMPALYSFWSSVLSEQRAEVAKLERMVVVRRSVIARDLLEKSDGISKWKIDELVETDDKLNKLIGKTIIVKRTESKLFGIVKSMEMKSDSLRSLAGFKRQELHDAK